MDSLSGQKLCSKCEQIKPVEAFHKAKGGRLLESRCRVCRSERYRTNREAIREYHKRHLAENRDRINSARRAVYQSKRSELLAKSKEYRQANPEKIKARKKKYYLDHLDQIQIVRKAEYQANRTKYIKKAAAWAVANPEKTRAAQRRHRQAHLEEQQERSRLYRLANPEKERARRRNYKLRNRAKTAALSHRRRARKRANGGNFTPEQFIELCAHYGNCCLKCGRSDLALTPDHIVPLSRGGSNHISNIQPMCLIDNLKKGTKIIDYRPDRGAAFAPKQASLFG